MKLTRFTSEHRKRIQLYLKYKAYFDNRILQDMAWKQRKGPIAIAYLSTDKTLKEIGVSNHIGQERVRRIVAEFLRKVQRIYLRNAKELEQQQIASPSKRQEELMTYLVKDHADLEKRVRVMGDIIQQLQEIYTKPVKPPVISTREELRKELFEQKPLPKEIKDGDDTGYFLDDVKIYLNGEYSQFLSWYRGKTGGIVDGKVYVFTKDLKAFLAQ